MSGFESPSPAGEFQSEQPQSNESPFAGFVRNVKKCGRESAMGKDSLPNLVGYIAEAVNNGALDPNEKFKGTDGKETNAANFIFNVYATEEGKKAVHERSKLSQRAQVSKINKIIGASAKANVNFRGTLQRALEMRPGMYAQGDRSKVKSAFDHYVSLARAQLKKDTDLTPEEIQTAGMRSEAEENTVEKEFVRIHKKLGKLLTGGKEGTGPKVEDDLREPVEQMALEMRELIRANFDAKYDEPKAAEPAQGQAQPAQGQSTTHVVPPGGSAFAMQPQQPQQPAQPQQ